KVVGVNWGDRDYRYPATIGPPAQPTQWSNAMHLLSWVVGIVAAILLICLLINYCPWCSSTSTAYFGPDCSSPSVRLDNELYARRCQGIARSVPSDFRIR